VEMWNEKSLVLLIGLAFLLIWLLIEFLNWTRKGGSFCLDWPEEKLLNKGNALFVVL